MEITVPATMGGKDGMKMTVNLVGPMWIVKGAPGTAEYSSSTRAPSTRAYLQRPERRKAQPGQAKAMAEMYRQIAAAGGIAYETEMNVKMSGEGPMAGMLAKMGNIS